MAVTGGEAVSVVDDQQIPIRGFSVRVDNHAVGGSVDLRIVEGGYVQAEMKLRLSIEWIGAIAVMASDRSPNRPYVRRVLPPRRALDGDLLEQRQMVLHFRGPALQKIDTLVQVR